MFWNQFRDLDAEHRRKMLNGIYKAYHWDSSLNAINSIWN